MEHRELTPLKWPEGWGRTLIAVRKNNGVWKKPLGFYHDAVLNELKKLGVSAATVSYNGPPRERVDPGAAVWFSLKPAADFTWQPELQLENPAPSLEEIDAQYRLLVRKHHPDAVDLGSGGDKQIYLRLSDARKRAKAWVLGNDAPVLDNCIPCDRFTEIRQNLAAIRLALAAFRQLERVGIPAILERVMDRAFRTALPKDGGVSNATANA
jgi:hypothetical protein